MHMKVHRHLRATGSPQSIKVKNVTGLPGVAITYGSSHDQSFTHTHTHSALTCFSVLIWSALLGIHVVKRSVTNGMKFTTNCDWFNQPLSQFFTKNPSIRKNIFFLSQVRSHHGNTADFLPCDSAVYLHIEEKVLISSGLRF